MHEVISATEQLTVHLIEPSTMTWAVVQNGDRIHEGSFEMCEEFLDWHQNSRRVQAADAAGAPGQGSAGSGTLKAGDKERLGHGIAAFLGGLFTRPQLHGSPFAGEQQ